jgi:hypothetical protein
MSFPPALLACTGVLLASASAGPGADVRLALFSKRQSLWPSLDSAARRDSIRLGVLPVYLARYAETVPCDSCRRLSEDGVEFFLGNALRRILSGALGAEVGLAEPDRDLLRSRRAEFPALLDSLDLPWEKWLGGEGEFLVYRPRESMASAADKRRLDKAAGALGLTHVFLVRDFRVRVRPESGNTHRGGLEWSWRGALYHAAEGRFEWAVEFSQARPSMDLDEDLEPGLTRALGDAMRRLPADLNALLKRELR